MRAVEYLFQVHICASFSGGMESRRKRMLEARKSGRAVLIKRLVCVCDQRNEKVYYAGVKRGAIVNFLSEYGGTCAKWTFKSDWSPAGCVCMWFGFWVNFMTRPHTKRG